MENYKQKVGTSTFNNPLEIDVNSHWWMLALMLPFFAFYKSFECGWWGGKVNENGNGAKQLGLSLLSLSIWAESPLKHGIFEWM